MNIIGVCALSVIAAIISIFIKQYRPEFSSVVSTAASVTVLVLVAEAAIPLIEEYFGIADKLSVDSTVFNIMFKALGISYLTYFAADICRDMGQTSLASKVETAGKFTIVILSFPIIKQIISFVSELK